MHIGKYILRYSLTGLIIVTASSPILAKPSALDWQVQQKFEAAYTDVCDSLMSGGDVTNIRPAIFELKFRYDYEEPAAPMHSFRLYEFACFSGAYNMSAVYFGANEYEEINQIHFALPAFDITYKDDVDAVLDQITINGFTAWETLTNPSFDQQTQTLISHSAWRGLGDASSSGRWVFEAGKFVLKTYDVDPTYDGEINPIRIYGEGVATPDIVKE